MNGLKNLLADLHQRHRRALLRLPAPCSGATAQSWPSAAIVGGYLGARIAHRLGRTFVRRAVVAIGLGMGIAMFFKR